MKIDAYAINTASARSYEKTTAVKISITEELVQVPLAELTDTLEISDKGQEASDARQTRQDELEQFLKTGKTQTMAMPKQNIAMSLYDMKLTIIEQMIQALTGRKPNRIKPVQLDNEGAQRMQENTMRQLSALAVRQGGAPSVTMMQRSASVEYFSQESETVSYQARGIVQTADGKRIDIDISMYMSRETAEYAKLELYSNDMVLCDPLVINYGGTAASLTDEKFDFDLNADGVTDQISFAGQGNGFLALDKNGDGTINDGRELFGPQTGSGFGELRTYDRDGNGWIDESDEIFDKLVVWSKDKDGHDQLFKLKDLDIGAIYLGDIATQFTMNGSSGSSQGMMQSSSFYLKESGGAGMVSHIDLAI